LVYDRLNYSLFADELAYGGSAIGHSIQAAAYAIKIVPSLGSIPLKILIFVGNVFLVTALYFLWRSTANIKLTLNFVVILLFFLALRFAFILKGGNGNPHPPMGLLLPLISSVFFGISNFGLKISYFACYLFFLSFIFSSLVKNNVSYLLSVGAVLAIATIPITLDLSTVIEHSLFAYIFIAALVTHFAINRNINYSVVFAFITIGALFRQSILLFCAPVLLFYIKENYRDGFKKIIINCTRLLAPCLLFLPIVLNSLINGTPSTEKMGALIKIDPLIEALHSGFIVNLSEKIFQPQLLILFFIFFIPLTVKDVAKKGIYVLYFALLLMLYFSISPGLWSNPKYQAEYIAPFITGSIVVISCLRLQVAFRPIQIAFIYSIFILNLLSMVIPNKFGLEKDHISVNYPYVAAYKKIKDLGLNDDTYSIGITYGSLPEILNSYTGDSWDIANKKYKYMKDLNVDLNATEKAFAVNQMPNNMAILIQGEPEIQKITPKLLDLGWQEIHLIQLSSDSPKIHIHSKNASHDSSKKN
jgi:hypothetical protein